VAESEIQSLKENLSNETTRSLELGKELEDLKSCCTCSKGLLHDASLVKVYTSSESKVYLMGCGSSNIDEVCQWIFSLSLPLRLSIYLCCENIINIQRFFLNVQNDVDLHSSDLKASYCSGTLEKCDSSPREDKDMLSQVQISLHFTYLFFQ
jgi:hypothetical protein